MERVGAEVGRFVAKLVEMETQYPLIGCLLLFAAAKLVGGVTVRNPIIAIVVHAAGVTGSAHGAAGSALGAGGAALAAGSAAWAAGTLRVNAADIVAALCGIGGLGMQAVTHTFGFAL